MPDTEKIEERIYQIAKDDHLPSEQVKLAYEITVICEQNDYVIKKMGSYVKGTLSSSSDIDLLGIVPDPYRNLGPAENINHLKNILKNFNPQSGMHSVKITRNKAQVEIIPGIETKDQGIFKIPTRRGDKWEVRGQDNFNLEFTNFNKQLNGKLVAVVKILKIWKEFHANLIIPSLVLEKVAYDVLVQKNNLPYSASVVAVFNEFQDRILKNIKHPEGGTQINPLSNDDRVTWSKVLQKNYKQLSTYNYNEWVKVLGPDFDIMVKNSTRRRESSHDNKRKPEASFG